MYDQCLKYKTPRGVFLCFSLSLYFIYFFCCILLDKTYVAKEEIYRFEIFRENVQEIEEHNKLYHLGKKSYYMGVNQFSDLVREANLILKLTNIIDMYPCH